MIPDQPPGHCSISFRIRTSFELIGLPIENNLIEPGRFFTELESFRFFDIFTFKN